MISGQRLPSDRDRGRRSEAGDIQVGYSGDELVYRLVVARPHSAARAERPTRASP